jgi:hypothetical protein
MMRLGRSASIVVALLLVASVAAASAECTGLPLRTFTVEERQRLELQHGVNWWKVLGLIPGPQTAGDWMERPAGDSLITVFSPQQFWDPRSCAQSHAPGGASTPHEFLRNTLEPTPSQEQSMTPLR